MDEKNFVALNISYKKIPKKQVSCHSLFKRG